MRLVVAVVPPSLGRGVDIEHTRFLGATRLVGTLAADAVHVLSRKLLPEPARAGPVVGTSDDCAGRAFLRPSQSQARLGKRSGRGGGLLFAADAHVESEGTASVLAVRPALSALEETGVDGDAALHAAGISRAVLESMENRVPYESVCRFWQAAAAASGDSCFGLHIAETLPIGAYDVVDYVMSAAPTLGEGLTRLSEYVRLIYDQSNLRLLVEPGFARIVRRTAFPAPHYDEFTLALLLMRSRQASGIDWKPDHVGFVHERREARDEVCRIVGSPVDYGQGEIELRFSRELLDVPHQRSDSRLQDILMRHGDSLLASLPDLGHIMTRVSSCIAREMSKDLPTLLTTAAALHMTPRTLQRQLAKHGASYSALVDEVRRSWAMKFIGDAAVTISEIGYQLHFSDATAFHRAFRRWTGEAPLRYRRRLFETSVPSRRVPHPNHRSTPAGDPEGVWSSPEVRMLDSVA